MGKASKSMVMSASYKNDSYGHFKLTVYRLSCCVDKGQENLAEGKICIRMPIPFLFVEYIFYIS